MCHTVVVVDNVLRSESPDELALVSAAEQLGCKFLGRYNNLLLLLFHGKELKFEYLGIIYFDSDRKRMSVVVRDCDNNKTFILTKGADDVILSRANNNNSTSNNNSNDNNSYDVLQQHLHAFGCDGLRTLLLAYKEISQQEAEMFLSRQRSNQLLLLSATTTTMNESEQLDFLENDLIVVGASAVEDELQEV